MSLRVAKEHQQLIRDIGLALRTRPELVYALRDVLQSQHVLHDASQLQHSIALRDTDVLQSILAPILDRIAALEEREPRIVRMEALEARITALEERESMPVTGRATSQPPAPRTHMPRPAAAGKRRSPKGVTCEPPPRRGP